MSATDRHGLSIARPQDEKELRHYTDMIIESLRAPPLTDFDDVRLIRVGDTIAGGLMLIPMGQFFGGVSVPMVGIHAVAVLPEFRGRGVGTSLMRAAMKELYQGGTPISGLYPATQPL